MSEFAQWNDFTTYEVGSSVWYNGFIWIANSVNTNVPPYPPTGVWTNNSPAPVGNYVKNPMVATLDSGNFSITNTNDIQTTTLGVADVSLRAGAPGPKIEFVDAVNFQSIAPTTFQNAVPQTPLAPTAGDDLCNRTYVDSVAGGGSSATGNFAYSSTYPGLPAPPDVWYESTPTNIGFSNTGSAANQSWLLALQAATQTLQDVFIEVVQGGNIQSWKVVSVAPDTGYTFVEYLTATIPPMWTNGGATTFYFTIGGPTGAAGATGPAGETFTTITTSTATVINSNTSFTFNNTGDDATLVPAMTLDDQTSAVLQFQPPVVLGTDTLNLSVFIPSQYGFLLVAGAGPTQGTAVPVYAGSAAFYDAFTYNAGDFLSISVPKNGTIYYSLNGVATRSAIPPPAPTPTVNLSAFATAIAVSTPYTFNKVLMYPFGAAGATGPTGPTGATGATGPTGPAGPTPAQTNIYYVAKNGNDGTADGSIAKPYLTIQAAINAAQAGALPSVANPATIFIAPGNYTENITMTDGYTTLVANTDNNRLFSTKILGTISIAAAGANDLYNRIFGFQGLLVRATGANTALQDLTVATEHSVIATNCRFIADDRAFYQLGSPNSRNIFSNCYFGHENASAVYTNPLVELTGPAWLEANTCEFYSQNNTSDTLRFSGSSYPYRIGLCLITNASTTATAGPVIRYASTSVGVGAIGQSAIVYESSTNKAANNPPSGTTQAAGILFDTGGRVYAAPVLLLTQNQFVLNGLGTTTLNAIGKTSTTSGTPLISTGSQIAAPTLASNIQGGGAITHLPFNSVN